MLALTLVLCLSILRTVYSSRVLRDTEVPSCESTEYAFSKGQWESLPFSRTRPAVRAAYGTAGERKRGFVLEKS
jgi:hypothetical protein